MKEKKKKSKRQPIGFQSIVLTTDEALLLTVFLDNKECVCPTLAVRSLDTSAINTALRGLVKWGLVLPGEPYRLTKKGVSQITNLINNDGKITETNL